MMNKKLSITMVVDTYGVNTNGTTITAMRMTEALRKRGHKVYVLTGFLSSKFSRSSSCGSTSSP